MTFDSSSTLATLAQQSVDAAVVQSTRVQSTVTAKPPTPAEWFASGFSPIPANGKKPAGIQWQKRRPESHAAVAALFAGHTGNVALMMGGAFGLVGLDFDTKGSPEQKLAARDRLAKRFAGALIQETPSGGLHVVLRNGSGLVLRNSTAVVSTDEYSLDLRSEAGVIIAAGSTALPKGAAVGSLAMPYKLASPLVPACDLPELTAAIAAEFCIGGSKTPPLVSAVKRCGSAAGGVASPLSVWPAPAHILERRAAGIRAVNPFGGGRTTALELVDRLASVCSDSRETYISGMRIIRDWGAENECAEIASALARAWAQGSPKFNAIEFARTFASLGATTGGLSIATLIKWSADAVQAASRGGGKASALVELRSGFFARGLADTILESVFAEHLASEVAAERVAPAPPKVPATLDMLGVPPATPAAKNQPLIFAPTQCAVNHAATRYIVKGLISRRSLVAIYAASGMAKTFCVGEMCFALATGKKDFFGKRLSKVPVLYLALEGVEAIVNQRVPTWRAKYGDPGSMFSMMTTPPMLSKSGRVGADGVHDGVAEVVAALRMLKEAHGSEDVLLVVDTLARAMAGDDENSASDMAAIVAKLQAISSATDAAVLIVHHSGKDATKGMRGSSAFFAACDTVIEIKSAPVDGVPDGAPKIRSVVVEKSKDGTTGPWFNFTLKQHVLGIDQDGDAVTSCTLEPVAAGAAAGTAPGLKPVAKSALGFLADLAGDARAAGGAAPRGPAGEFAVATDEWREDFCVRAPGKGGRKVKVQSFLRSRRELEAAGMVGHDDLKGISWLRSASLGVGST